VGDKKKYSSGEISRTFPHQGKGRELRWGDEKPKQKRIKRKELNLVGTRGTPREEPKKAPQKKHRTERKNSSSSQDTANTRRATHLPTDYSTKHEESVSSTRTISVKRADWEGPQQKGGKTPP